MDALAVMLGVATEEPRPETGKTGEQQAEEQKAEPSLTAEQQEALQEKELGTAAYKKREFEAALQHYERALSLDPTNASVLANKSAVLFEMGSFEECIGVCEEAVRVGREHHAEFKLIGRVLGRAGSCYDRLGNLDQAIKYYNKSLTEARSPEIHEKLKTAERAKAAAEKAKLYDPALAEQERTAGNDAFKKGDWVTAVKHYTEAIKRDEKDPRAYSNRAACYLKLAAIQEGLRDADKCLELDAAFVKGYLRKAALLFAKREYNQAIAVCDGKHRHEFQQQISKCYAQLTGGAGQQEGAVSEEERARQAMQNPEVQEILGDPAMRLILKQMESDPKALMEHMKNPHVAAKIRKLIQYGVLRTG
jgi:stress-induced-phosphoprotein 1